MSEFGPNLETYVESILKVDHWKPLKPGIFKGSPVVAKVPNPAL
jgi:hypothetical protein